MGPDRISNIIRNNPNGPLGFGRGFDSLDEIQRVTDVSGRSVKVATENGDVHIKGSVMLFRTPGGLVAVSGGNTSVISIDDARKLLPEREINEIKKAMKKDRRRRKKNLQPYA